MSARYDETAGEFPGEDISDFERQFERQELHARFAALRDELLANSVQATPSVDLHRRFKQAANEAAGLAWTTAFPLLVFPGLFEEIARRERFNSSRQESIRARTEHLMEQTV